MTTFHESTAAPRRARRWRRGAALAALATVGLLAGPAVPAAQAASDPAPDLAFTPPARGEQAHGNLASSLQDDLSASQARTYEPGSRVAPATVTVVVQSDDVAASRQAIADAGGNVTSAAGGLLQADVPPAQLGRLADADGTQLVREPIAARTLTNSEGVAESGANAWIGAGKNGSGVKVAIVDVGFQGYATKLGGELPASGSVETDLSRCTGDGSTPHGTAVAEVVHDEAPGSPLLLVCAETDVEFADALSTLAGKGVKVVNGSIGFAGTGRGDGSGGPGSPSDAVAKLRRQGILYIAAAGNYGQTHWNFTASGDAAVANEDDMFNDLVNIDGENPNDDQLDFLVAPNATVGITVVWDEWPTAKTDFDAYAGSDDCNEVGFSVFDQGNNALPPFEYLEVTNCTSAFTPYSLIIDRFKGSGTPRMDVFFDGPVAQVEHFSASSLPEPASSPAVMTVGAHCWVNGAYEPYSSVGPTIDNRVKPDITGPDGTSSSVYGPASPTNNPCKAGFTGTSAAAPHVTGAAADLLSANGGLDVAELQKLLEDRSLDSGPAGKDIVFGSGRLRLGAAGSAPAPTPRRLSTMTPLRLFDSRADANGLAEAPFGPNGRTTPLGPKQEVAIQVAGIAGVPADATAVVLNVTVTSPTQQGWITVHPDGTVPDASNVNFVPGQTAAAHVTATVAADKKIRIWNSGGSTHVVVDIAGWYGPTGAGNLGFTTLAAPSRAFDSRADTNGFAEGPFGPGGRTTPIGANTQFDVQLAGLGGIPADAKAVAVNLTTTSPNAQGWLTMYPTGAPLPSTSTLNYVAGLTVANLAVMPLGTDGKVTVRSTNGTTHVVMDVVGYYTQSGGAGYVALDPPTRDLDSRNGNGPRRGALGPGGTFRLEAARYYGVPARAAAVVLNVIAVFPTKAGWLTVYPGTAPLPNASNLNFTQGTVVPNAVISALGADGTVAINNAAQGGNTDVVSDLAGYFVLP